jgi:pimeloyl-ACP methyl ester carboxylesterase
VSGQRDDLPWLRPPAVGPTVEGMASDHSRAAAWRDQGAFFDWAPATGGPAVRIFHGSTGPADGPVLLLVHGFPTSSVDWFDVVPALAARFRVCWLDFPGYGFSDKPADFPYSLQLDADLLEHFLTEVMGADRGTVVAHDRGDSVALILHERSASGAAAIAIDHLVLTNGNMFLPLSNLTPFQRVVLDPTTAPELLGSLAPEALAVGMGRSTFTPPRGLDDPAIAALAECFATNDGIAVLHHTIQYLRERARDERRWLEALAESSTPTTLVWGVFDDVSPVRVANHVWQAYLRGKPASNEYWLLPAANHYLQGDQPDALVDVLLASFDRTGPAAPGPLSPALGAPIRVDHSSATGMPAAEDAFAD